MREFPNNPLQKEQKLPTRQIHRKHSKSVSKLIVCKFTDGFMSPSVITNGFLTDLLSVGNYGFWVNSSINPSSPTDS